MITIVCEKNNENHDFYLVDGSIEYYLFSQKFKKNVNEYFSRGVDLDKALRHGRGKRSQRLHHTMDKLMMYIKYIEKEYNLVILNDTKEKICGKKSRKEFKYGN